MYLSCKQTPPDSSWLCFYPGLRLRSLEEGQCIRYQGGQKPTHRPPASAVSHLAGCWSDRNQLRLVYLHKNKHVLA